MAKGNKGLRSIRTMAGLVDQRRTRTPSGALLEMSVLANEKERLQKELAAARRRHAEIERRLTEIAEKEARLQKFIRNPALLVASSSESCDPPLSLKTRELRY